MLWNTFNRDRKRLESQYHNPVWDKQSGWNVEKLEHKVHALVQNAVTQPRIRIKAEVFAMLLLNGQIEVDPKDWFADRLQHGDIMTKLRGEWMQETGKTFLSEVNEKVRQAYSVGAYMATSDFGHTAPDWESILTLGPSGLLKRIREARRQKLAAGCLSQSESDFYAAAETAYAAVIKFILRLAEGSAKMAAAHAQERERMLKSAECLRNIARQPPATMCEAMQLAYIYHELQEMEGEPLRSMGGFDRLYNRFYAADLASGRYTRDQAKELIKYFFIKFFAKTGESQAGKNFFFGGIGPDGNDAVNPLSAAALEAYDEMQTVNPKLSVRVHQGTPDSFLEQVANCIRHGNNGIVLTNDEVIIPTFLKRGMTLAEAHGYTLIGCYEPAVMGKEISCSCAGAVNIAKAVELALYDGMDPLTGKQIGPRTGDSAKFISFNEFYGAVKAQLAGLLEAVMASVIAYEKHWKDMNPSPLLSGTMAECVANGCDISEGGAKYNNSGCYCACLASAVDSLWAVRKLVFEQKALSLPALASTLKNDWADNERLRMKMLHSREKWGNNRPGPDALGCDLAGFIANALNNKPNGRGGYFNAALFSIDWCHLLGRLTGALPDGRKSHQPLSKNLCAVTAMDREGVTALINSVTKLDFTKFPDGSVLDIMLHPTAVQGEDGLKALIGLIRSYFELGGFAIQFNIFDATTLHEAQKHPERYSTLQVRVCGWNVCFVNLSHAEQEEFIKQAEHLLI